MRPAGCKGLSGTVGASTPLAAGSNRKETNMVPILLWLLGVPGLIIIVLLLLGVIHL